MCVRTLGQRWISFVAIFGLRGMIGLVFGIQVRLCWGYAHSVAVCMRLEFVRLDFLFVMLVFVFVSVVGICHGRTVA